MTIETHYRGHIDPGQYIWARAQLDELMNRFRLDLSAPAHPAD